MRAMPDDVAVATHIAFDTMFEGLWPNATDARWRGVPSVVFDDPKHLAASRTSES